MPYFSGVKGFIQSGSRYAQVPVQLFEVEEEELPEMAVVARKRPFMSAVAISSHYRFPLMTFFLLVPSSQR